MMTRTAASRSSDNPLNRTLSAPMPPADPTTATTWTGGRSAVGARAVSDEQTADRFRLLVRFAGELLEPSLALLCAGGADACREPLRELRPLLQGAERRPERSLDGSSLRFDGALRRVRVSDAAAKARQLSVFVLPQHAAARGAAVDGRLTGRRVALQCVGVEGRVLSLESHISIPILAHFHLLRKTSDGVCDRRGQLRERQHAVRVVA